MLDALEDYGLIRVLLGTRIESWSIVARISATGKFALVGLALLYVLVAGLATLVRKPVPEMQPGF